MASSRRMDWLQFAAAPQAFQGVGGGVAYIAHIGGFLAGVALIPFFKQPTYPRLIGTAIKHGQVTQVFQTKARGSQTFQRSAQQVGAVLSASSQKPSRGPGENIKQRAPI